MSKREGHDRLGDGGRRPSGGWLTVALHALVLLIAMALPAGAQSNRASAFRPGAVMVRFKSTAPGGQGAALQRMAGSRVARRYTHVHNLVRVDLPAGQSVADAVEAYRRDPAVLYAEPDYVVHAVVAPNDSLFNVLWNFRNNGQTGGSNDADIDAPEAWDITPGDPNVVVAILDSGIDYTHPDLAANVYRNEVDCDGDAFDDDGNGYIDDCNGIDTANDDSDPFDDNGHGTHVAGIIGAIGNNATGVVGVNWHVKLLPCKFLDQNGDGFSSDAIDCLDYLADFESRGIQIVASNNSWGGDIYSQALSDAIDVQRAHGALFIAAAGNFGISNDIASFFPAGYEAPNLIAVAASNHADVLANFSNYGRHTVHIAAPGVDILSTLPTWDALPYDLLSGTSMAAPHVTGVAALLKAQDSLRGWQAIRNRLLVGADTVPGAAATISQRRLNARGALTCAGPAIRARLRPTVNLVHIGSGEALELAALHIGCSGPLGAITVSGPGGQSIPLLDDGTGFDVEAGDGVYSGAWTAPEDGIYTLTFPDGDEVEVNSGGVEPGLTDPDPRTLGQFGAAVETVGARVVIGHPNALGTGGAAYVFDATTGDLLHGLDNPNPGTDDAFGRVLAAVGTDKVLVGASRAPVAGTDGGLVYLFDVENGALLHTFQSPAPLQNGLFGWAVASIDDRVIAIDELHGAPPTYRASVHLFDAINGAYLRTLQPPVEPAGPYGQSLASDGPRLYLSEPGYDAKVYVHDADPASATFGDLLRTLRPPPGYPTISNFGWTVVANADRVFVGAPASALPSQLQTGSVHVFDAVSGVLVRNLDNPVPATTDPTTHLRNEDNYGGALALVGPTLLVGADSWVGTSPLPPPSPSLHGAVYRFDAASGEFLDSLPDPFPRIGSSGAFGYAVAGFGDSMIVGNPYRVRTPPVLGAAGAAYIVNPGPLPDAGKCYKARLMDGGFGRPVVALNDQFGPRQARVVKTSALCNPTQVDESSILHPDEGRTCYKTKPAPNQPKFIERTLTLINRYEVLDLEIQKPASVCLPAIHGGPGVTVGDAFTCYKAKVPGGSSDRSFTVEDAFGTRAVVVGRVASVCVPTGIDGSVVQRPDRYLLCHKIKSATGPAFTARDVQNSDGLHTGTLRLTKSDVVCLPSRAE